MTRIIKGFSFLYFFAVIIVHVSLLKNFVLFDLAFCLVYVGYILFFNLHGTPTKLMLIGLGMGLMIDFFYNSMGLHALGLVTVAYVRTHWLTLLKPRGGYTQSNYPSVSAYGLSWFILYIFFLLLIHHAILFIVEANGFGNFDLTFVKILASAVLNTLLLLIWQHLFSQ